MAGKKTARVAVPLVTAQRSITSCSMSLPLQQVTTAHATAQYSIGSVEKGLGFLEKMHIS